MCSDCLRKRYLLTLYRQGVFYNDNDFNAMSVIAASDEMQFFSTDYFDKLVVEEININKDLAAFMGMEHNNGYDSDVIAVHNYSIYQDIESQKVEYVNDIFNNRVFPYLGLVHVYITPDVFLRIPNDSPTDYIQCFEKDLQQMVEKCNDLLGVSSMVFKMLSTSDFMVVVRSDCPEKIISIATKIRSRKVYEQDSVEKSLSVYKTYTITTLNSPQDDVEIKCSSDINGKVAIRGRYSNLYWISGKNLHIPSEIVHLHGRYDFMVYLSHQEFMNFYPLLCKVKGIKTNRKFVITTETRESGDYSEELYYLYDLISDNLLSYLNERYLINVENEKKWLTKLDDITMQNIIEGIDIILENETQYLFERNHKECIALIEDIGKIRNQYDLLEEKSCDISLDLLCNLVGLCQNVNSLSDARIYVVSLLHQIQIVLNSLKKWLDIYTVDNSAEMRTFMQNYLRKSVVSLDAYGSMIRNNNLQTLQAPSYNAVSGVSMEKILIGYSRFLTTVMDFCCSNVESYGKKYFPVMIPKLSLDSLSIEVMFPEWNFWGDVIDNEKMYFMVASGPATAQLVNMAYMVTTLFHEMAHHLRYEERKERNEVILRIMVEDLADVLTHYLFTIVVEPKSGISNVEDIQASFHRIFTDALNTEMLEQLKDNNYMQYSLENFKQIVQKKLNHFLQLLKSDKEDILFYVQGFIDNTNEFFTNDQMTLQVLADLSGVLNALVGRRAESYEKCDEYAAEKAKEVLKTMNEEELRIFEKSLKEKIIDDVCKYVDICEKNIQDDDSTINSISNMKTAVIANIWKYSFNDNLSELKKVNVFFSHLHKAFCEIWKNRLEDTKVSIVEKKEWIKQGRRFGIDYNINSNQERFKEYFTKAIRMSDGYSFECGMKRVSLYREETSDLFMCAMCDLDIISYLAICAEMHPLGDNGYDDGYIERFTDIILVQWFIEKENDLDVLDRETIEKSELLKQLKEKLSITYSNQSLRERINSLQNQILDNVDFRLDWFRERKYLIKDYLHGKNTYKNWREGLVEKDKYKRIVEFCKIIKEYLSAMGNPNDELQQCYNDACIDFITGYYYDDMLETAKRGIRDGD